MEIPKTDKREQLRLDILIAHRILDSPPEKEFDIITELTAEIFDVPLTCISFLDKNRVWHKSLFGTKSISFSFHEILRFEMITESKDFYQSEDITKHKLFRETTDATDIRFLAFTPIKNRNGVALGAISIMDTKPRKLSVKQQERLKSLSNMVMKQVEFRLIDKHFNQYINVQTEELQSALAKLKEKVLESGKKNQLLQASLLEEKQLSKMRAQIFQSISDQFRSPLTTITSSAQLIEMTNKEAYTNLEKHLNRILHSVQTISGMMDDVLYLHELDFVNLEEGATEIEVKKVIYRVLERANLETEEIQNFKIECIEGENLKFYTNKEALEKLLKVLASNAIKHNTANSPIRFQYSVSKSSLQFNINNRGEAIEKEELPKIFDLFFKGSNSSSKNGLGMGLSIGKKLIDSLGGKIKVESSETDGTTFYVLIPTME